MNLEQWLLKTWYENGRAGRWLRPLAGLTRALVGLKSRAYRSGLLSACRLDVPVIVVGNITAGGTGKTPLVIRLVELVREAGLHPGILCRGYRGKSSRWPQLVDSGSDPQQVGDEAVLLAVRSGVPVAAGPDRCAAGKLLTASGVNLVIADDGLQHLRLQRDFEVAVIDGRRLLGNEQLLPAGPLREPPERLASVDVVVINDGDDQDGGGATDRWPQAIQMNLMVGMVQALAGTESCPLESFAGKRVHAIAGIGNPARFFETLRRAGLDVEEHAFGDHADYTRDDLEFDDDQPILMTEKDAVKCRSFARSGMWVVPVTAHLQPAGEQLLQAALVKLSVEKSG